MRFHKPETAIDLATRPEHDLNNPLSVHAMTVAYDRRPVLWDVDYDVSPGSLVAVVGPNGAGKSTFIKACLGLIPRASGTVRFWGERYQSAREKIAYVPQRESVDWEFPVSALDVVAMGRYGKIGWCRRVSKQDREESRRCLDALGMADYAGRQINQLSGGQQQRVFLARALAQEAELYFMDEPLAGVDATTEKVIVDLLHDMQAEGKTVISVHHDLGSVPEYFSHVLMLNARVVAAGPVETTYTEENLKRTFGGKLPLLDEVSEAIRRAGAL